MTGKTIIAASFAALTLSGAVATATVHDIPSRAPRPAEAPQKRVLNDVKDMGTYMFAATAVDCQHERSFVNFYTNKVYELNKMGYIWEPEDDPYQMMALWTGCNTPDGYFGMIAKVYTFYQFAYAWIKVDTETGQYEILHDYYNDDNAHDWEGTHDMAWNPGDGKVYGVAGSMEYDPETEAAKSMVGYIDTTNGYFTKIKTLDEYYFCIAFDYDGTPWGIRWLYNMQQSQMPLGSRLVKFKDAVDWEVDSYFDLKVDGQAYPSNYIHTLDFDYTTGDLYWGATNNDARQSLVKINPETGETERLGSVGFSEVISGLYIPYVTADHREAPARVSGLSFTPSQDGSNSVTLSWTNPTKQWNRKDLTQLGDVEIYRDDMMSPIDVVSGMEIGGNAEYTDTKAPQGIHTYYVVPTNDKGLGVMDSIRAFSGHDVPGHVENLVAVATTKGDQVTIGWKQPNIGANDGWFDASSLKYTLVRYPDGKVLVKDSVMTANQKRFIDKGIESVERYTYVVTASNADGEGVATSTDEVLAGVFVPVPYATDFSDKNDGNRWTAIDANGDGKTFTYKQKSEEEGNAYMHELSPQNDDYLVSPPFNLEGGKTYKVTFNVGFYTYNGAHTTHNFNFVAGTDMNDLKPFGTAEYYVEKGTENRTVITAYLTPDSSDTWYVALNNVTGANSDILWVTAFTIEEEFADDMAALSFDCPLEMVEGHGSDVTVQVYNNGYNTQSKYKVQLVYGRNAVIGETEEVPALASRTGATVEFKATPIEEMVGQHEVFARVVLEGDMNEANNVTAGCPVDVLEKGSLAINHEVDVDRARGIDTRFPFAHSHYYGNTLTQTIYPAVEHMIPDGRYIHRIGWEYTALEDFSGVEVAVALGQTSTIQQPSTSASACWWLSDREDVCSGRLSFSRGTHFAMLDLDKPFRVDADKSLVVTVAKNGGSSTEIEWPLSFAAYETKWTDGNNIETLVEVYEYVHSLFASSASAMTTSSSPAGLKVDVVAPKLLLALSDDASGVEETVVLGGASVAYEDGVLRFAGIEADEVDVYSMSGSRVATRAANGADSVRILLGKGVYAVAVTDIDGNRTTVKVLVK